MQSKRSTRSILLVLVSAILPFTTGCQSAGRIFHRPQPVSQNPAPYYLAANATTKPATQSATSQPASTQTSKEKSVYSSPGARVQTLTLYSVLASYGVTDTATGAGREQAESALAGMQTTTITGRAGLTAPQPQAGLAVSTRGGIFNTIISVIPQRDPTNHILNAGFNPASGPNGICNQLDQLGFPGYAICTQHGMAHSGSH